MFLSACVCKGGISRRKSAASLNQLEHRRFNFMERSPECGAEPDRLDLSEKGAQNDVQASWAANVRTAAGRQDHRAWKTPQLDPASCLDNFKVVLVGTKKAPSIGTVARALGAFECLSLCCVASRVKITCRPSLNTSKGAQHIVYNAQVCDTLEEALQDCTYSVAFARWACDGNQKIIHGLPQLTQQPEVVAALAANSANPDNSHKTSSPVTQPRVALVFGREYEGLAEDEIKQCSASCCITMGRLQESLSISHAVCLALGHIFEHKLSLMPFEYRDHFKVLKNCSSIVQNSPVTSE